MFRYKPEYYLRRLESKGWTLEQIQKKTRIHALRLKKLYLPNCVPTREEMVKINSLFKLTAPSSVELVKQVWSEANSTKPGLVNKRLDEKDEESVRFYSITRDGIRALHSFGI